MKTILQMTATDLETTLISIDARLATTSMEDHVFFSYLNTYRQIVATELIFRHGVPNWTSLRPASAHA